MLVVTPIGQKIGLSSLLQWIVVPAGAFAFAKRVARAQIEEARDIKE